MREDGFAIVENGSSEWVIALGRYASPAEQHAAEELRRYVRRITGAALPIRQDDEAVMARQIILGVQPRVHQLGVEVPLDELGEDGYIWRTTGDCLVIAGSPVRGTLYGVYSFLEEILGCRWYAPGVERIPQMPSIHVPALAVRDVPALEYREPYSYISRDARFASKHKVNGNFSQLNERQGGAIRYTNGSPELFVHTFDHFIPVAEYYATHPEYFSEINGQRIADQTQLCLTNPEVVALMIERVREYIADNPGVRIVSVSQNDWYNPCACQHCKQIDDAEQSHSGTLIAFVNQIAEALESDYPDVAIDTLAYQYTRKPPKNIRPHRNVIVRLCSIECCFAHPLESCSETVSFKGRTGTDTRFTDDLRLWKTKSERLYIWDYVTNFSNYVMPFPNFRVLQGNIRFFIDNHVKGLFEQGCSVKGGEFQELRTYVLAKLLWNPDVDVQMVIDDFVAGFYGQAGPEIGRYIQLMHDYIEQHDLHMGIYDPPTSEFLDPQLLAQADEIFDRAEALAESEAVLKRVKQARLPLRYVQLYQMSQYQLNRKAKVKAFFEDLRAAQIMEIWEGRTLEKSEMFMEEGTVFISGSLRNRDNIKRFSVHD